MIAETTVLFLMGDKRVSFITYNTMNILSTSQEGFCDHIERYLTNLRNKSTLISNTAEKERNKFFKRMYEKIRHMKSLVALQPTS